MKAFNVLSAYSLSLHDPGRRTIPIASDHQRSKEIVSDLIQKMGFIPEDRGLLSAARLVIFLFYFINLFVYLLINYCPEYYSIEQNRSEH